MPDMNMRHFEELQRNQHSIDVEIDASQIISPQQNFPMMLETPNSSNSVLNVIAINELGEQLPTEIAGVANDNNWVHLKDLIHSGWNRKMRIFYGGCLGKPAVDSAYGSQAVWSSYEAVWLMNEDPTGTTTDRTGNGHDGTGYGFVSGDLIDNTYGKRVNFDGTDAHIDMNRIIELEGVSETWTIGTHAAFDVAAANNCLFGYNADGTIGAEDIYTHYASATSTIKFGVGAGEVDTTISDVSDGNMHFMTFGHTAANAVVYEDGANKYDAAKGGTAASAGHTFKLGENYNIAYLNGKIGFAYIHPDALPGGYITTQYKNLNNPTAIGTDPFYKLISKEHNFVESLKSFGRAG